MTGFRHDQDSLSLAQPLTKSILDEECNPGKDFILTIAVDQERFEMRELAKLIILIN